jgi:hypothetical protein
MPAPRPPCCADDARHPSTLPRIRIRSYNALSAFEQAASQPDSPCVTPAASSHGERADSNYSAGGASTAHAGKAGRPPDSTVHLRRVTARPKPSDKGLRGLLYSRWLRLLRGTIERRIVAVVSVGLLLGCMMHAVVYWRGTSIPAMPAPTFSGPLGGQGSLSAKATQRRLEGRPHRFAAAQGTQAVVQLGNEGLVALPWQRRGQQGPKDPVADQLRQQQLVRAQLAMSTAPLGMPGDSDSLPDTPVWDAEWWQAAHRGLRRISPDDPAWPNTIAICAMMKDEHPDDVAQWLKYHRCATTGSVPSIVHAALHVHLEYALWWKVANGLLPHSAERGMSNAGG